MRYRKLSASGDFTFGHQQADFHIDSPEGVAQAIGTRLGLFLKEYFVDTTQGTPWRERIYGKTSIAQRDTEIQAQILGTQGVLEIVSFSSYDTAEREYNIQCVVATIYGNVNYSGAF